MRRLLLGLIAWAALASAAHAKPPVWVVRDRDSEMLIFGSVHVLPNGLDWRPARLNQALPRAADIWFELPMDAATERESARLAGSLGRLPPGQSLLAMLKPEDASRLRRAAETYRIALPLLDQMQPWMAELMVAEAVWRRHRASSGYGVERILAEATPRKVRRRAFETPAEQLAVLSRAPRAEQIAALSRALKDLEANPNEYMDLVRHWLTGDLKALERDTIAPLREAAPTLYRQLNAERNARWAKVLHRRLKGRGRTVVVVGVGHLIGPQSLPARLRALGYSVEGP